VVLDHLNARLRSDKLWFPVDVSTSAQATIGGMAGNNSCGSRSIRYGNMVHNVLGVDAWLSGGDEFHFGPSNQLSGAPSGYRELVAKIHAIVRREAAEIDARWPNVLRRVQGYNLDMVQPGSEAQPLAHNLAICSSVRKARWHFPGASCSSSRRFRRTRYWAWCIFQASTRRWI
jgi:hypothetical protein